MSDRLVRLGSWIIVAIFVLGTINTSLEEQSRLDKPRPLKPLNELRKTSIDKSRPFLVEKLEQTYFIKKSNITFEKRSDSLNIGLLVKAKDKKQYGVLETELKRLVDQNALTLNICQIDVVKVQYKGELKIFQVNPYMDYWPSFETEMISLCDKLLASKNFNFIDANTIEQVKKHYIKDLAEHLQLYEEKNPFNLELFVYRLLMNKLEGNDITNDINFMPKLFKASEDADYQKALAISSVLKKDGFRRDGMALSKAIRILENNLSDSWFRNYLIAEVCITAGQAEKAIFYKEKTFQFNALITNLAYVLLAFIFTTVSLLMLRDKKTNLTFEDNKTQGEFAYGWWKPWAIAILYIILFSVSVIFLALLIPSMYNTSTELITTFFSPVETCTLDLIEHIVFFVPILLVTWLFVARKERLFKFIKFSVETEKFSHRDMLWVATKCTAIAMVATAATVWFCSNYLFPPTEIEELIMLLVVESNSVVAKILIFISVAVIPPFFEEAIFRGIIYCGMRRHWSVVPSVIVSSLLFAILHLELIWWLLLDKFIFGVIAALATEKTGSIYPGMICHAVTNGLIVCLMLFFYYR